MSMPMSMSTFQVSAIEMEDNCGVDMSGQEVLPTSTVADCNGHKDPDASHVFVAGNGAVAEELADGKSEPIEKLGSFDLGVSNDAAELGVALGGSPMKNGLSPSDEIGGENGAFLAFQAEKDKVYLGKAVEQRKESLVNDLENHSENIPLVVVLMVRRPRRISI